MSAPDEDCSQLESITSLVFTAELDEAAADSIQPSHVNNIIRTGILVDMPVSFQPLVLSLPERRRPQGLVVIGVCLSVCMCVCAHSFVRKISHERVHGSPPNLVGASRE